MYKWSMLIFPKVITYGIWSMSNRFDYPLFLHIFCLYIHFLKIWKISKNLFKKTFFRKNIFPHDDKKICFETFFFPSTKVFWLRFRWNLILVIFCVVLLLSLTSVLSSIPHISFISWFLQCFLISFPEFWIYFKTKM